MRQIVLFLLIILIPSLSQAQRWKKNRWEFVAGLGTTSFLGDLGGGHGDAAHFLGIKDMDIQATRPLFHIGLRYKLEEAVSTKLSFSYGLLSGDDALSKSYGRWTRNLSFRSPVYEISDQMEFSFLKEKIGSRYAISRGGIRNLINAYVFLGVGAFYFNPQSQYNGKWYDLQPLGTEGQGLTYTDSKTGQEVTNPPKYSRVAVCFPLGIGVKYSIGHELSIGLEIGLRYTTTDYIDDVGGSYFNFEQEVAVGNLNPTTFDHNVINFADRHYNPDLGRFITGEDINLKNPQKTNAAYPTGTSFKSGQQFNDTYTFMIISIVYRLKTTRNGLPKF